MRRALFRGSKSYQENVLSRINLREEALDIARGLHDAIRSRVKQTESDRVVPKETIDALRNSGLFNIITPKSFGGSELGFTTLVEVTAEIASACGSTGWVFGVLAGHSWMLNLFPLQAQQDVLGEGHALTATVFRLGGTITEVDGGYKLVNGDGRFCSGIDHVQWVIIGNAMQRPDGPPEPRFFVIPRSDIEIVDDWHTAGLRGTGSRTIKVAEAFIPKHRSVSVKDMMTGNVEGADAMRAPIYRMPFQNVTPFSLIGAPLGIARAALRSFGEGLAPRLQAMPAEQMAEQSATLERLAHATADLDAAYALILEDTRRIDTAESAQSLTALEWSRIPRNWAYSAQTARRAANSVFEAAGGTSIYNASELQRIWRDVNSAAQHFAFTWDSALTAFGRQALGLPPSPFGFGTKK
ncbi:MULTISPECIES: acyl-CoA dehydrogenase family protein [unclassified Paraburkholderia]|uniref:acyl-CoA dehydrogenase family protein n=1 Tax=unclassified Paraburkholderia TaxID=2615204 RepID=UPI00181E1CA1|nr:MULTISPECIES: acyl-CoA dehydrogenase family protein [unclassified Paraburkholderia]MBB5445478.1 3-hydroxy-9,10-secoandrosta-1,3,5(10)-triene-9,17-dione monooxygenase [Paraburkholderia sp. WSM4177]MBB5486042.1 3-hydroxy-9,10-secoandrosta-1,3,5(10)-triene-9,17-dione monooxygenase [Paraburkholderia sp. WSM4180]